MKIPAPPREGESVLFCPHAQVEPGRIRLPGSFHWFLIKNAPATATRKIDHRKVMVRWIAACEPCTVRHAAEIMAAVTQDGAWIGEPPEIKRVN